MKLFMQRQAAFGACSPVGRQNTVVCQARGFGNRKRSSSSSRKTKPATVNSEAQQLLGEYSAVKHSPLPIAGGSRATPTSRTKQPTTEASAAIHSAASENVPKHAAVAPSSTSSKASAAKPAGWGITAVNTPSPAPVTKPAADTKPRADIAIASSVAATDGSSATEAPTASSSAPASPPAGPAGTDVPLPLPVPSIIQAAGARHAAFESKLTTKSSAPAEAAPQLPKAEEPDTRTDANRQLSSTISLLSAAHDDLGQAGAHVDGLAQLLQEAQGTLASLQSEEGSGAGPEQAAVGLAAGQLVGLMSDVLSDITAEMGLVSGQLLAARVDIDASLRALEEAAQVPPAAVKTAAPAAAPTEPAVMPSLATSSSSSMEADNSEAKAAAAAAAAAEREAVAREVAALRTQLELRDAELAVVQQRNSQLQAQMALLSCGEPGGAEGDIEKSAAEVDPRIRALLASQVASNMALLDWLAALAKTVVGLEGVAAADRVRLATAISKCVLAVGGGIPGNSSANATAAANTNTQQQQN